jgi:protease I
MTDATQLTGMRVAILATDGVEQSELVEPRRALDDAGAATQLISLAPGEIQAMEHDEKGDKLRVEKLVEEVEAADYDALLLPGGVANPDRLRTDENAVDFVRDFFAADKPVAAICHGPWMLVEADTVRGRTLTSWPSVQTDIRNAGGEWVDQEVVRDGNLVTSRKPDDIPRFDEAMLELFAARTKAVSRDA